MGPGVTIRTSSDKGDVLAEVFCERGGRMSAYRLSFSYRYDRMEICGAACPAPSATVRRAVRDGFRRIGKAANIVTWRTK